MGDKRFVYEFLTPEHVLLLLGQDAPLDEEWDAYLAELVNKELENVGVLGLSGGGGPNAAQRARINDIIGPRNFRRAIVTDSRLVQGMVTTLSWFAQGVKAFTPKDWEAGARYAGFPSARLPKLRQEIRRVHQQLATPIPWLEDVL